MPYKNVRKPWGWRRLRPNARTSSRTPLRRRRERKQRLGRRRELGLVASDLRPRRSACGRLRRERPVLRDGARAARDPESRRGERLGGVPELRRRRPETADGKPPPLL